MSNFSFQQPKLEQITSLNYKVLEPYTVQTSLMAVTVPSGFVTDLASVPRALWSIFPPFGLYTGASVVHDYIYRTSTIECTKNVADMIFKELMQQASVPNVTVESMFLAVQAFGRSSFKPRKWSHL